MAVICWGSTRTAVRKLQDEGVDCPSESTIAAWKNVKHADLFDRLREQWNEKHERDLEDRYRANAARALEYEELALEKTFKRLEAGKDEDPSRTAANLATVADKNARNMLSISGRPTNPTSQPDIASSLRALQALGLVKLTSRELTAAVDAEAEQVEATAADS